MIEWEKITEMAIGSKCRNCVIKKHVVDGAAKYEAWSYDVNNWPAWNVISAQKPTADEAKRECEKWQNKTR